MDEIPRKGNQKKDRIARAFEALLTKASSSEEAQQKLRAELNSTKACWSRRYD